MRRAATNKKPAAAVQSETAAEKKNEEQQSAKDNMMEPNCKNDAKPPPVNVASLTVNNNEASVTKEDAQDDDDNNDVDESDDDVQLALEYMETAWSILDQYSENPASYDNNKDYTAWAKEQAPRFLTGIGDVLSALQRHADATDAYCRALGHRQEHDFLQCRRRLVETNVLIAEELLACPPDQDVIDRKPGRVSQGPGTSRLRTRLLRQGPG